MIVESTSYKVARSSRNAKIDAWLNKNKDRPLIDLNFTYLEGSEAKGGIEILGQKARLGFHIATIENTYNAATGANKKGYSGIEGGIGPFYASLFYIHGTGWKFDYEISTLKNLNSDPRFNIFSIEVYAGGGGKVSLDINPAKYITSFDPTLDYRYLYLYK